MNGTNPRLDDERRVRSLSPAMLIFKRFARNRLAIAGFVLLALMFAFAFLGGLLSPYDQTRVFKKTENTLRACASASKNTDLRVTVKENAAFPAGAASRMVLAVSRGDSGFESEGAAYRLVKMGADFYRVDEEFPLGGVMEVKGRFAYAGDLKAYPDGFKAAFEQAALAGAVEYAWEGETYSLSKAGKGYAVGRASPVALATTRLFESGDAAVSGYAFRYACLSAIETGANAFWAQGAEYRLEQDGEEARAYRGDALVAVLSRLAVRPAAGGAALAPEFAAAFIAAADAGLDAFEVDGASYALRREEGGAVTALSLTPTQLIDMYAPPSASHVLGTDQNGMDVLTRLMYGGRVSLLVGFVVVLIETLLGVLVGGAAGYFGGWTDTLLMRFVDLFNCVPYWPMMIIAGAVMDTMEVDPYARIFLLMLIMGLMGWTTPARMVRGQILSLREQDFMVAAEATGIRVSRRIFGHLIPNVMPLLIVQATMNLGNIIITEATLSFLGLGIKFPLASWGSIINSATNLYVMTHYPFLWIPAGLLILLTVLGFNFAGDGLRDAFDPRTKQ